MLYSGSIYALLYGGAGAERGSSAVVPPSSSVGCDVPERIRDHEGHPSCNSAQQASPPRTREIDHDESTERSWEYGRKGKLGSSIGYTGDSPEVGSGDLSGQHVHSVEITV